MLATYAGYMACHVWLILAFGSIPSLQASVKKTFVMDKAADCNANGFHSVPTGTDITIIGKSPSGGTQLKCYLQFQAEDNKAKLDLSFNSFVINDCDVVLYVKMEGTASAGITYDCNSAAPGSMLSETGKATISLDRRNINDNDYSIQLTLRAYRPDQNQDASDSNPIAVGLVVGIVGGVVGFILILCIIGICCYRKKRQHEKAMAENGFKVNLEEAEPSSCSYGYANEIVPNGTPSDFEDTPRSDKKLLANYNKPYTDDPPIENQSPFVTEYNTSPKKASAFEYNNVNTRNTERRETGRREQERREPEKRETNQRETQRRADAEQEPETPKSPLLSALHSSAKFRASFIATEAEADERARRISSYSSDQASRTSSCSESPDRKEPLTQPPPMPAVPIAPKSPAAKRQNHASLRRARPLSSSEEIAHLTQSPEDYDDANIRVIHDSDEPPSPNEIVPIKVKDPYKMETKPKYDTKHTLRPNRGRSPEERRKQSETGSKKQDTQQENDRGTRPAGGFQKNNSLRKRSQKSPRLGRQPRPSTGSILDDTESVSRPGTPTSMISRLRDDDLDSNYSPLRRSGSRQSLYASRSSLYGRRGHRERRNSIGESVSTYARDDLDAYEDFESRPMSRRDYNRGFKSLGDIEYEMREKSTQTLRETATQTGQGRAVVMEPRRTVSKKSLPRNMSTSASQTVPKKEKQKEARKDADDAKSESSTPKTKRKTRRKSESEGPKSEPSTPKTKRKPKSDAEDVQSEVSTPSKVKTKPKVQSKPKPAPRKLTAASAAPAVNSEDLAGEAPSNNGVTSSGVPNHDQPIPVSLQQSNPQFAGQPVAYLPQYIAPGGMPVVHPYPGAVMPHPQSIPQVMYAPAPHGANLPPQTTVPGLPPTRPSHGVTNGNNGPPSLSGKPRSKWEILCSLTDSAYQSHPQNPGTETGSVTGSVFSSAPNQPYDTGYQPIMGSGTYAPSTNMSGPVSDYGSGFKTGQLNSGHSSSSPSGTSSDNAGPASSAHPPQESTMYPRKSSWEALRELTDTQYRLTYGSNYEKSESTV